MFECFMLQLEFCKTFFDSHLTHRFGSSDANAFRTFDWEIPNCRAIRDVIARLRVITKYSSSAGHPAKTARQLPDQSTTLRVESSSTDDSRLRGALPGGDIGSSI